MTASLEAVRAASGIPMIRIRLQGKGAGVFLWSPPTGPDAQSESS